MRMASIAVSCRSLLLKKGHALQGDVMSGAIATFYGWATEALEAGSKDAHKATESFSATVLASYGGTLTARYAAKAAFAKRKRSMIAVDLIEELGFAVDELFDKS